MRSTNLIKPLSLLIATLLIGMLLGAAITGRIVQSRMASYTQFTGGDGFAAQIIEIIEPESEAQRAILMPILDHTGQDIHRAVRRARLDVLREYEALEAELLPHLTDDQMKRLRTRREQVRSRMSEYRKAQK